MGPSGNAGSSVGCEDTAADINRDEASLVSPSIPELFKFGGILSDGDDSVGYTCGGSDRVVIIATPEPWSGFFRSTLEAAAFRRPLRSPEHNLLG
jgi:hypothetical protein